MDPQEEKNKETAAPEDIKMLEKEMKSAYSDEAFSRVKELYDKITKLDPENRLAQKLMGKAEKAKAKMEKKEKKEKAKEYVRMLRSLYKEKDLGKLEELIREFKEFDPENKHALKWERRVEKLREKLGGEPQVEQKKEQTEEKKEEKKDDGPVKPVSAPAPASGPIKPDVAPTPAPAPKPFNSTPAPKPFNSTPALAPVPKPLNATNTSAPLPATPAPATPAPATPAPASPAKPAVTKEEAKESDKKEEKKGNLFTRMFGKKDDEIQKKSIIDTIVAKTDKDTEAKKAPGEVKQAPVQTEEEMTPKEDKKGNMNLLTFSKIFMNFALIFIVFSAAFLYVEWIDKDNTVLALAGVSENTGARLRNAADELEENKEEEEELNEDIDLYKGGYEDTALQNVNKVIEKRINWPDIFEKIKEVTNSVYELNEFFNYIEYNNYSFDAEKGTVRVSGTLSDPLGRNLTKLVELELAFKNFPRDMNDPEDTTEPYFSNFDEFTSFSKTYVEETGRYTSSFSLSFALNE